MAMAIAIDTINGATLAPLGPRGEPSGIVKQPLPGPWTITETGVIGDAQGDLRHHGGPEKALHHYPRDHYAAWAAEDARLAPLLEAPAAFGENLSTFGMTEQDVCIGDTYALGPALLQVAQGRQPCWKLNARSGVGDLSRRVQETGRTGWYYRVLRPGTVEPGATLDLAARPRPDWPLSRLIRVLYRDAFNVEQLGAMADLPELAEGWRELCRKRLRTRQVEDWKPRLEG